MLPRPCGLVTLLTDFGAQDPYVAIMKGAALRSAPKVGLVDVTHDVPPQDIAAGAFLAWTLIGRFPSGSVHVVVVDPGVGTTRALLAVAAHDAYWLAPDNGVLTAVLGGSGAVDVRALDAAHLGVRPESRTFHGRDVLAPIAAGLATGRWGFSALGPRLAAPVTAGDPFAGPLRVVHVDRYGNLITNLRADRCDPRAALVVAGRQVPRHGTYGEVRSGELLACAGSHGLLEIAVRDGAAARLLNVGRGEPIALSPA